MSISILALVSDTVEEREILEALQSSSEQSSDDRIYVASPEDRLVGLPGSFRSSGMRLVLIDSGTLARKGSSTVMMLQRRYPRASIVCIGGRYSRSSVLSALSLGVHGFIARSQTAAQIRHAINIVLNGGIYLPDMATECPGVEIVPAPRDPGGRDDGEAAKQNYQSGFGLSPRQAVVLTLLSEGMTNKAIARHLDLAEATVKVHVSAIYRALNVRNRAGAVAAALSLAPAAASGFDRSAELAAGASVAR